MNFWTLIFFFRKNVLVTRLMIELLLDLVDVERSHRLYFSTLEAFRNLLLSLPGVQVTKVIGGITFIETFITAIIRV